MLLILPLVLKDMGRSRFFWQKRRSVDCNVHTLVPFSIRSGHKVVYRTGPDGVWSESNTNQCILGDIVRKRNLESFLQAFLMTRHNANLVRAYRSVSHRRIRSELSWENNPSLDSDTVERLLKHFLVTMLRLY